MIRASVTVVMATLVLGSGRSVRGEQNDCAHYEPAVVRLNGHLSIDKKYGPPNFGETPAKDEKLHVAMLHLTQPLDVCGDQRSVDTGESFKGLRTVQLNFMNLHSDPNQYADQNITVRGTLYRGFSGYHHTEVVMTVDSVGRTK